MHNGIHYEPILVVLSYVISVLGSYTALQLAIAIPQARGRLAALGWTLGAALALGGGAIWSMHFIAMNAADMGMPVSYDAKLTFASLVMGVLASAIGLYVVGRGECPARRREPAARLRNGDGELQRRVRAKHRNHVRQHHQNRFVMNAVVHLLPPSLFQVVIDQLS